MGRARQADFFIALLEIFFFFVIVSFFIFLLFFKFLFPVYEGVFVLRSSVRFYMIR